MTQNERNEVIRDGLPQALGGVQRYHKTNEKRLLVSDDCRDIKRLINEEAALIHCRTKTKPPRL
jgi:hypothetical protein